MAAKRLTKAFEMADSDKNGIISEEEVMNYDKEMKKKTWRTVAFAAGGAILAGVVAFAAIKTNKANALSKEVKQLSSELANTKSNLSVTEQTLERTKGQLLDIMYKNVLAGSRIEQIGDFEKYTAIMTKYRGNPEVPCIRTVLRMPNGQQFGVFRYNTRRTSDIMTAIMDAVLNKKIPDNLSVWDSKLTATVENCKQGALDFIKSLT